MSAALRVKTCVLAGAFACLVLSNALAQQQSPGQSDRATGQQTESATAPGTGATVGTENQNQTNYRAAQAAAGGSNNQVDHYLATCLLGQNKAEIELSQIAMQRSENAEVKQFAQKMITDHQKMVSQLQPLAMMQAGANRGASSILGGTSESQGRSETTEGRSSDTRALPGSSGASQTLPPRGSATAGSTATPTSEIATAAGGGEVQQLMQIDRQINERCLQMAKTELQEKSGVEFDKCYVGNAVGMHAHALAALQVIGKQSQGTIAQVAQQAQPTVQQHLEHAKQLMKQLDGQATSTAQRQTKRTE